MRSDFFHLPAYSSTLLSIFDIGGSLLKKPISNGLDHDMNQLMADHKILEEDYKRACERIQEEIENEHLETKKSNSTSSSDLNL